MMSSVIIYAHYQRSIKMNEAVDACISYGDDEKGTSDFKNNV
jgi:hypothetical protein